jgi:hypothetical protein
MTGCNASTMGLDGFRAGEICRICRQHGVVGLGREVSGGGVAMSGLMVDVLYDNCGCQAGLQGRAEPTRADRPCTHPLPTAQSAGIRHGQRTGNGGEGQERPSSGALPSWEGGGLWLLPRPWVGGEENWRVSGVGCRVWTG